MGNNILVATSKNVRLILVDTSELAKELINRLKYPGFLLLSAIQLLNISSIMSTNIKGKKGKFTLILKADGLLGNAFAISRSNLRVTANAKIDHKLIKKINEAKTEKEFSNLYKIGSGVLIIENDLGLKMPYRTSIPIDNNMTIEKALEEYYTNSEQLNTIINPYIDYVDENTLRRSSCLFIQQLPNASDEVFKKYQKKLDEIYSLNVLLDHNFTLEKVAQLIFENIEDYSILDTSKVELACSCSYIYFKNLVESSLSKEEIKNILEEYGYVETTCSFCNRVYRITEFN